MKLLSGLLAGMVLSVFQGCLISSPCEVEGYRRDRREIPLRMVSTLDSFSIRYERWDRVVTRFPVREIRNDALGDTVICRFVGIERRYGDRRHANQVTVEKSGIRISHRPLAADSVDYADSSLGIKVLRKTACTLVDPGFDIDSLLIEMGAAKKIAFDTLNLYE